MIQIYKLENHDYDKNGDMTLFPSSCNVHAELNGSWYTDMVHPVDKLGRWKYIVDNAVVKAPSFNGDQLFRIKTKTKTDSGIEVRMEPIFYDAMNDCWLTDVRPTGKNGQEALNIMLQSNSKYSAESNISKSATAYYQYLNFFEALNGDIDQSFINRWGGEILYDNFKVIVNERVGGDYGVELLYGKNIEKDGLTEDVDITEIVTRIYPKAYNGYVMSDYGYVDSPLINDYPIIYSKTITFDDVKMAEDAQEDDEENGIIVCNSQEELDDALQQKCKSLYDEGLDKPNVSLTANMVLLQNTKLYEKYKILETVSLGDTVHCKHNKLGIVTDVRVTSLDYDCIQKKVTDVSLGDFSKSYFDSVTSTIDRVNQTINTDGSIMAEKIAGIINGIKTQIKLQSTASKKVDGIAFRVEDLDPESPFYGCMIWGTQGLQISKKRTADGRDWDWSTAMTAGGIIADSVITGKLSDSTGENYWDLDTGEFRLSGKSHVGDKTADELVQDVQDALEKSGKAQAMSMQLDNEYQGIPTDSNGYYLVFPQCKTTATVFFGSEDITNKVSYNVTNSDGISGYWTENTHTYTVTGLSEDTGWVDIKASYLVAGLSVTKRFTVIKQKQGDDGANGVGIDTITNYYLVSEKSSGITTSTSGWQTNPPVMTTTKKYLWNYEKIVYSDKNTVSNTPRIIGVYGDTGEQGEAGNGIKSITEYYLASSLSSGVSTTTSGWTTTIQNTSTTNKYLWNYEVVTYTNGNTYTSKPVIIGTHGATGTAARTYFIESSASVLKRSKDNSITPNFIEFKSYYRDGNNTARTSYSGRWIIEETTDGNTWKQIYASTADENTVRHQLYSLLVDASGNAIVNANGDAIGITRDIVQVRAKLYASGGTVNLMDMQSVAVVTDVDALTPEEVFNLLTNNGEVEGIYQLNGQLYINGTYIATGKISSKNGKVYFDLENNEIHCDKMISTETYAEVQNTVIDISRKTISGSKYKYGQQIYNTKYPDEGITISPGYNSMPEIHAGAANAEKGFMISANVEDGTSFMEMYPSGIIWVECPGDTYFYMYPGNYKDSNGSVSSMAGRIEFSAKQVTVGKLVASSLTVNGTKSRTIKTKSFGDRLQYCYEMSSPMFGDIGESMTDENGESYISIDEIFSETVSCQTEYQVFLQKEGSGDIWVEEKNFNYFLVKGTPNLKFSWEIKVKQKDYEYFRLDEDKEDDEVYNDSEEILVNELERIFDIQEEILWLNN